MDDFELGYSPDLVGTFIDPPSGWQYGFPKHFVPNVGETLSEYLKRMGYPEKDIPLALKYSRFIGG